MLLLLLLTNELVVACPATTTTTTSTAPTRTGYNLPTHNDNNVNNVNNDNSGEGHHRSLMVDGKNTIPGRYPYHTQVGCCSGVLIAPDIVLTAGHDTPPLDVAVGMKVTVGAYYTDPNLGVAHANGSHTHIAVRTVTHAMLHPNYTVIHNDYAILVLDQVVSDALTPAAMIRLNRNPAIPRPYQNVTVLGTGTFNLSTNLRSKVLQEGTTQYVPTPKCRLAYDFKRGISYGDGFLDDTNLCTMGGADGCAFDSGAPLLLKHHQGNQQHQQQNQNHQQQDLLLALVSYGVDCADPVYPAVNARISAGHEWIDSMVCQYSVNPPADFQCNTIFKKGGDTSPTNNSLSSSSSSRQKQTASLWWIPRQQEDIHWKAMWKLSGSMMMGLVVVVAVGLIVAIVRPKRNHNELSSSSSAAAGEHQQLLSSGTLKTTLYV